MLDNQIIENISKTNNIKISKVNAVLNLLSEGNTVPFIARYRKEVTGALNEEQIRVISKEYEYSENLKKRKEDVIRLIDEKGLLTEELRNKINKAEKLIEVEDIYRPFKEKKKTKATDAINNGLEPLAKIFMSQPKNINVEEVAAKYLNENVKTVKDAITGAKYIMAEYISDNAYYRKAIRGITEREGIIVSKKKKKAVDDELVYEMYYDYEEKLKQIRPHRVLAINRAEKEKVLSVSLKVDKDKIINFLETKMIKNPESAVIPYIKEAIQDSYKRLIKPSIERELRSELTDKGEDKAINIFSQNLNSLLLTPPIKNKVVLGVDPAFRTGCKLAIVDKTGKLLDIDVIYPHPPKNKLQDAKKKVKAILENNPIEVIAIGNGTASRETETFITNVLKELNKEVFYLIVNEAGASVYSASKEAKREFPKLQVEERSAVSIARRLQDPLAELVKIDPKSIGVGQYQHDVKQAKLNDSLNFVVEKVVNQVGVNVNTASSALLQYVSGLSKTVADNIINVRDKTGGFTSRKDLLDIPRFGNKTYEQAIGFLRVINGENKLDQTPIHPESYSIAKKILKQLGLKPSDIGTDALKDKLTDVNKEELVTTLGVDIYTLEDIIEAFESPNRDPRDDIQKPALKTDILKLKDLAVGMKLEGTVRNVVDFGAFIDIGLKQDGLVHISKISNQFIKHPLDVLNVGQIVTVWVSEIHEGKGKVSLSMLESKV